MPTAGKTSSHTRIARAPQQTKLPLKRNIKRRQPRQSLPLLREQTLTQIEWVRPSLRTNRDRSSERSEYSEDEDSDSVEMPPRKRRRTYGRGRAMKQTTVTQNWRDFVGADSSSPHGNDNQLHVIDSDDDAQSVRHPRTATLGNDENVDPEARHESASGGFGTAKTPQGGTLDHAEYLLSIASSQQSRNALNLGSSDNERASGRPTPASSVKVYKTPQKPRRTVVPSSETPSSIRLSDDGAPTIVWPQQSPLKERSSNLQPSKQRDSISKSLCKHRTKLNSTQPGLHQQDEEEDLADNAHITKLDFASQRPVRTGARTLQRVTTIQDSEDDEPGLTDLAMEDTDEEEQQEWQPSVSAMRSLRRATTVQESQVESDLEELEPEATQLDGLFGADAAYDPMYQQTFDPVLMALERDATRFGRSDTQFTTRIWAESTSSGEKSPSREYDVSAAALNFDQTAIDSQFGVSFQRVEFEPRRASVDEVGPVECGSYEPSGHTSNPMAPLATNSSEAHIPNDQATEHRITSLANISGSDTRPEQTLREEDFEHEEEQECDRVPSSIEQERFSQLLGYNAPQPASPASCSAGNSPRLNRTDEWENGQERVPQSQISTVMPTQCSRPSSAHGREQQSHSMAYVNTLSSSPFPLPPCDDTQGHYRWLETQVTDFSLPPPPTLSSSLRQQSSL